MNEPKPSSRFRSGWHSSKLHLALISMVIVTGVFFSVLLITNSAAGFDTFCLTIVSLAATYSGARVGETFAQRGQRTSSESTTS